jgi:phosphatidylserine decarboxylase
MKLPIFVERALHHERVNFVVTNRIPRRLLTRFMGWFSRIELPIVRRLSIAAFEMFSGDLRLHEAKQTSFRSLHDCFVRELKTGARPVDRSPSVLVSPCDGIVGAAGAIDGSELLQAKGSTYSLEDLLRDGTAAEWYHGGCYVTLRLTANMYHRFHAPADCVVEGTHHVPGDFWNVNPPAVRRLPRLYCRNERVVLHTRLSSSGHPLALVAVGAILVGSVQLHRVVRGFGRGDEMGYFRHGSTIIVIAGAGLALDDRIREGAVLRMGEPLLQFRHAVRSTGSAVPPIRPS